MVDSNCLICNRPAVSIRSGVPVCEFCENIIPEIMNVTPHPITMQTTSGFMFSVPTSGIVVNAKPVESVSGSVTRGGVVIELAKTVFESTAEESEKITAIESHHPDAVIVGSMIAAQAFPGRIFAMVPVAGFERVAPAEKRMRCDKFTVF